MDRRVLRTKAAIRETFVQMMGEMELPRITVKALTDRAGVNRKTFYLHYETIDFLVAEVLDELCDDYIATFEQLPEDRPHEDANATFFRFFAAQPDYVQQILCHPPYEQLCNRVFDRAYEHHVTSTGDPLGMLPKGVQNIIQAYYRSATLGLYRQWVADGRTMPLDELIDLSGALISHGDSALGGIINKAQL